MSFNINGPSNKPIIQETQNMKNNGGGGNLGYFKRGKKNDDENENPDDGAQDLFIREDDEIKEDKFESEGPSLFDKLKGVFKKKEK